MRSIRILTNPTNRISNIRMSNSKVNQLPNQPSPTSGKRSLFLPSSSTIEFTRVSTGRAPRDQSQIGEQACIFFETKRKLEKKEQFQSQKNNKKVSRSFV